MYLCFYCLFSVIFFCHIENLLLRLFYLFKSLSHQCQLMVFLQSLKDTSLLKPPGLFFSILADLNNSIVWIVSTRPLISKSPSPCTNPLLTVLRAPITVGVTVSFMYHSFFQLSNKVQVLIFLFACFQFYTGQSGQQSPQFGKFSFFLCLLL